MTVPACAACNSRFGHTFEGSTAQQLLAWSVLLHSWGVPMLPMERWYIPSFADWTKAIRPEPWMGRAQKLETVEHALAKSCKANDGASARKHR
jgi:hypothetical protein